MFITFERSFLQYALKPSGGWVIDSNKRTDSAIVNQENDLIHAKKIVKRYSIRRFLTTILLTAVVINTIIASIWVYRDAAHEVEELFDASLAQSARVLHGMLTRENITENKEHLLDSLTNKDLDFDRYTYEATPHGHKYEKKISFQVWDPNGELLLRSASIGDAPLSPLKRGFREKKTPEGHWRTFTLFSTHDNYWLIIAERDDIREELTHNIARDHMIPVLVSLPALGFLIWLTVGSGLAPLRKIAEQVESQEYEKLSEIKESKIPHEVHGLLRAINSLFSRLNQSYRREQRFVSDAAHELRNPLAGVLIHTENLLKDVEDGIDESQLKEPLEHIQLSTERLAHLVSQLLILSRTDSDHYTKEAQTIDLGLLASEVSQSVANPDHVQISCEVDLDTFKVSGNPSLIEALIRNLIDNAIRYSPAPGQVIVRCVNQNNKVELILEDNGPGINEAEREHVLKRFYRSEHVDKNGSGLGLAIVAQIASLHGATIEFDDSDLGGLLVSVRFKSLEI